MEIERQDRLSTEQKTLELLAERGYEVALLEAERLGWGASGRNGGQLNSGQRKGQGELERQLGKAVRRKIKVSAVAICNVDGANEAFREVDYMAKKHAAVN